jgi:hypothetical protein
MRVLQSRELAAVSGGSGHWMEVDTGLVCQMVWVVDEPPLEFIPISPIEGVIHTVAGLLRSLYNDLVSPN